MADVNMVQSTVQPLKNNLENEENGVEFEDENECESSQEFQSLNKKLDQLNSVLDTLETKTDDIHARLVDLLQSNREVRKQIQESREKWILFLCNCRIMRLRLEANELKKKRR